VSNTPDHEEAFTKTQTPESTPEPGTSDLPQAGQPALPVASNNEISSTDETGEASTPIRKVDPMQGMKLEAILQELVGYFGWDEMGYRINIRCFNEDPSIGSSLKFLRKTPWARKKVDSLFLTMRAEQVERFGLGTLD
jgi:DNA-binding protein VF530